MRTAAIRRAAVAARAALAAGFPRAFVLAAVLFLVAPTAARACQACFGAEDAKIIDGARAGAWVLIALTVTMQGAFAGFFFYLRRRFKRAAISVQRPEPSGPRP